MALPYKFTAESIIEQGRTSRENIDNVQSWVKTTKLPNLQEEFIVLFLECCNNDVEAAQAKIQNYFEVRSRAPELFSDRDIDKENLAKIREVTISVIIPKRMDNNTVILFNKCINTNYKKCILTDAFKQGLMAKDSSLVESPPENLIAIIDMAGISFMHLTCVKISVLKDLVDYVQDGMPLKIAKVHILNCNYIVEKILSMAKMFMRAELKAALQVHPVGMSWKDFHEKWIPAEYMPKEYDGDLPSYMTLRDNFIEEARELKGFFKAEEKLIESYKALH